MFISGVTTYQTEIKSFRQLKEFQNSFEIISATTDMLENIPEQQFWNNFRKFLRDEMKLFQTDVDKGWNDFEKNLFHM